MYTLRDEFVLFYPLCHRRRCLSVDNEEHADGISEK